MRAALLMAFITCAHCPPVVEPACSAAADDAGFALPADLSAELAATHQTHCAEVPDAGTYAWFQDCAGRFRDYMGLYCGGAVTTWCNAHCGSNDCGSALDKQYVNKKCAEGMLPGFTASLRYCSGLKLKPNESTLLEPDAGSPTCP